MTIKELCEEYWKEYKSKNIEWASIKVLEAFDKKYYDKFKEFFGSLADQAGCTLGKTLVKDEFGDVGVFLVIHGWTPPSYLVFVKVTKAGKLSSKYTKLYSLSRAKSGSLTNDAIVKIMASYEKTGEDFNGDWGNYV